MMYKSCQLCLCIFLFAAVAAPIDISYANGYWGYVDELDTDLQKLIHKRLSEEGYSPGNFNGKLGLEAFAALEKFRKDQKIDEGSEFNVLLTPRLVHALFGVTIEDGADGVDLSIEEQLKLITKLGLAPSKEYFEENGIILPD